MGAVISACKIFNSIEVLKFEDIGFARLGGHIDWLTQMMFSHVLGVGPCKFANCKMHPHVCI